MPINEFDEQMRLAREYVQQKSNAARQQLRSMFEEQMSADPNDPYKTWRAKINWDTMAGDKPFARPNVPIPTVPYTAEESERVGSSQNVWNKNKVGIWDVNPYSLDQLQVNRRNFMSQEELFNMDRALMSQRAGEAIKNYGIDDTKNYTSSDSPIEQLRAVQEQARTMEEAFNKRQDNVNHLAHSYLEEGQDDNGDLTKMVNEVAMQVSPWYKRYKGTEYLPLNSSEMSEIAAKYKAQKDVEGEDFANDWLNNTFREIVADHQGVFKRGIDVGAKIATQAVGSTAMLAGAVGASLSTAWTHLSDDPNQNWVQNYYNAIIDNDLTRWGYDTATYGSFSKRQHEIDKEIGIGRFDDAGIRGGLWSIPDVIGRAAAQNGFTLASIISSFGLGLLTDAAFIGGRKLVARQIKRGIAREVASESARIGRTKAALKVMTKLEKVAHNVVIPGLVGTGEATMEALGVKEEAITKGNNEVSRAYMEAVQQLADQRFSDKYGFSYGENQDPATQMMQQEEYQNIYNQTLKDLNPVYEEALEEVKYEADQAARRDFVINQSINGFIFGTLKYSLLHPSTQSFLKEARVFRPINKVTGKISSAVNAAFTKVPNLGKAWNIIREPLGEGLEEITQGFASSITTGASDYNINSFLENKFSGDATYEIGQHINGSFWASAAAGGEYLLSKDMLTDGFYGALGSVLGVPALPKAALKVNEKGSPVIAKDANGVPIIRRGKPVFEKTWFHRGLGEDGEKESYLDVAARLLPWRTGVRAPYQQYKADIALKKKEAEAWHKWLQDPKNKEKFDGLAGSMAWLRDYDAALAANDEFNARNAMHGKLVNDAFMITSMQGTEFEKSVRSQLNEVKDLKADSKEAESYIKSVRENINTADMVKDMSDAEIVAQLNKNADRMLSMLDKVAEKTKEVESLYGNIGTDAKQALVYGQLTAEDLDERAKKLDGEINALLGQVDDGTQSNLTAEQKDNLVKIMISGYGNIHDTAKRRDDLRVQAAKIKDEIASLKSKKHLTKEEKLTIAKKDAEREKNLYEANLLSNILKPFESETDGKITLKEDAVLTARDIMELKPITRMGIMYQGNKDMYKQFYDVAIKKSEDSLDNPFSKEQQAIIDKLVTNGMAITKNQFLSKIRDRGRIEGKKKEFQRDIINALNDRKSVSRAAQRLRMESRNAAWNERAKAIANMAQDPEMYNEFTDALDSFRKDAGEEADRLIQKYLPEGKYNHYMRLTSNNKIARGLETQTAENPTFKDAKEDEVALNAVFSEYLQDQGIDMNDEDAVRAAANETNEQGVNKFQAYLEERNQAVPEEAVAYTDPTQVFDFYKKVLDTYKADEEERKRRAEPIQVQPGVAQTNPDPQDVEANPLEEALAEEEVPLAPSSHVYDDSAPYEENLEGILENFAYYSSRRISKGVDNAMQLLDDWLESISEEQREEARRIVMRKLDAISMSEFSSIREFAKALQDQANTLYQSGNEFASGLLLRIAATASNSASVKQKKENVFAENLDKNAEANNPTIETVNLSRVLEAYPQSALARFIRENNMIPFLESNPFSGQRKGNMVDFYFATDNKLTTDVSDSMGNVYTDKNDLPVIILIKKKGGPYTIDGVEYQPVGILPATKAQYRSGSGFGDQFRALADKSDTSPNGRHLLMVTEEGKTKPLTTKSASFQNAIEATPADRNLSESMSLTAIFGNTAMSAAEQTEWDNATTKEERRDTNAYKRLKKKFLLGIRRKTKMKPGLLVGTVKETPTGLFEYHMDKMQAKGGSTAVWGSEIPMLDTEERNGTRKLKDVLLDESSDISQFNETLRLLCDSFNGTIIADTPSLIGNTSPASSIKSFLEVANNEIGNLIKNFIYLRGGAYKFEIYNKEAELKDADPTYQRDPAVPFKFGVRLVSSDPEMYPTIDLAEFTSDSNAKDVVKDIVKNMMLTEDGNPRVSLSSESMATWQLPVNDLDAINDENSSEERRKYGLSVMERMVDDGLLQMRATSMNYKIGGLRLQSPFKPATTTQPTTTVANNNNATMSGTLSPSGATTQTTTTTTGQAVDPSIGVPTAPTAPTQLVKSPIIQRAEATIDRAKTVSERLDLNDTEDAYIDKNSQEQYARTTKVLSALEQYDIEEYLGSKYDIPSQGIGNAIDVFLRDYFGGGMEDPSKMDFSKYPNATEEAWKAFYTSMRLATANLSKFPADLTFVSTGIKCSGEINVMQDGKVKGIMPVAGTIDLLAYDSNGKYYLFDFKSKRGDVRQQDMVKWQAQLSVYASLLEKEHGIKIEQAAIIPISTGDKYDVNHTDWTKHPDKGNNQVYANGAEYREARPTPHSKGMVVWNASQLSKDLSIDYNKLNPAYQELVQEGVPSTKKSTKQVTSTTSQTQTGQVTNNTPTNAIVTQTAPSNKIPTWEELLTSDKGRETAKNLAKLGMTAEDWNEYVRDNPDGAEQQLECCGW